MVRELIYQLVGTVKNTVRIHIQLGSSIRAQCEHSCPKYGHIRSKKRHKIKLTSNSRTQCPQNNSKVVAKHK